MQTHKYRGYQITIFQSNRGSIFKIVNMLGMTIEESEYSESYQNSDAAFVAACREIDVRLGDK